jgi:hypothetical protein
MPDLDLFEGDVDDTLEPDRDQITDSLSIGVGFEAVGATFTL